MLYTVGEMAKCLDVAASTLRYYDQEGLLPFVERSKSGIRMFTDKDYEWLKIIECLKKSGLSIKEIRAFIQMVQKGDDSLQERFDLFEARKKAVQKQIDEMKKTLDLLEFKCWYYKTALQDGTEEYVRSLPIEKIPEPYRSIKENVSNHKNG